MSVSIPYMGSKNKYSKDIVNFILHENPNCKYFFDLFGGGGAISFEALQRGQLKRVVYNELDTAVVELLKKIRGDGVTKEFYNWVGREEFKALRNGNDWKAGLVKTCWSFGNNGTHGYLFSKHIENTKKLLHLAIVRNTENDILNAENEIGIKIPRHLFSSDKIQNRRIDVIGFIKNSYGRLELQQLENINRLQQLERFQQLERLERFQQLERLQIQNMSYEDVIIDTPIDETIVYLDPPYIGTTKYQNCICHKNLYEYILNSTYKIYLSSYESDLKCVAKIETCSTLSSTNNSKKVVEKLFTNRDTPRN